MYKNLVLYRNELKNKSIPKYKLIGIVVELLLSKIIFKKNSEISEFAKTTLDLEFKNYILRSRTMIVSKICRVIEDMDTTTMLQKSLYKFVESKIELLKSDENNKQIKNQFDGWID